MTVKKRETNRIKRVSGDVYAWFWWHTEFWLDGHARRPYTFIMRDIYHGYPLIVIMAAGVIFYCLGRWWLPVSTAIFIVGTVGLSIGSLLGHLFWGGVWIPGEQEHPEYDPDSPTRYDPKLGR